MTHGRSASRQGRAGNGRQCNARVPGGFSALRIASWNANALSASDPLDAKLRLRTLRSLILQHDAVGIQETHGTSKQIKTYLRDFTPSHWVAGSGHANPHAGGTAILLSKQMFKLPPIFTNIVQGRAMAACGTDLEGKPCTFVTVHNYGLQQNDRDEIKKFIANFGHTSLFLFGDFNFLPEGEASTIMHADGDIEHKARRQDREQWRPTLRALTELHQPQDTRAAWRTQEGGISCVAARLDRCYTSLPGWQLIQLNVQGQPWCPASLAASRAGSDHAPLSFRISIKHVVAKKHRSIPLWIARHPLYSRLVPEFLKAAKLHTKPVEEKWRICKVVLKHVARKVHIAAQAKLAISNAEKAQVLLQAARAAWHKHPGMWDNLVRSMPDLQEVARRGPDSSFQITSPSQFSELVRKTVQGKIESDGRENVDAIEKCEALGKKPPRALFNARSKFIRWLKLWQPCDRKLVLRGVVVAE